MNRAYLLLLFIFITITSKCQPATTGADPDNVYKIYEEQFKQLLQVRGVSYPEIIKILNEFRSNNISSDKGFAEVLKGLYPSDKGIAIIFYFFNKDTLRRVLFEPGKIVEQKNILIKREELLQLSYDFNHVLGLYKLSDKRAPVNRGLIVKPKEKTKGATYESVIKKATALLLPEQFDQRYKHLIIIPALNIGTIPFYLLKPYADDSYLVDKCSYTVASSLIDLFALRIKLLKMHTSWGGDVKQPFDTLLSKTLSSLRFTMENPLFISNPLYPTNSQFLFPDLPGAKNEIDAAIPYAMQYKLLEGDKAIKDSVIHYMRNADVVYFATHGISDEEKPMEKSFLVLSGDDPFLTAKNIMDLRNSSYFKNRFPEMVILSACQTGLGKSMEAGIAGLARSFLLSGSNHIIMSLWNVDDYATAFLMNRFLFHLQQPGMFLPAEPMRKAVLDTKAKYPDPSKWASFSVFGVDY